MKKLLIFGYTIASLLAISHLNAAMIRVTTAEFGPVPGCDLYNAILAANTDTAQAGCPAGSGHDDIEIGNAIYALPNYTSSSNKAALPVISTSISILGNGATIHISKDADFSPHTPLLEVSITGQLSGGGFTLKEGWSKGLLIDGGRVNLDDITITQQPEGGISIWNNGRLVLSNSTISDNDSGAVTIGGIELYNGSELYLYDSIVSGNAGGIGRGNRQDPAGVQNTIHIEDSEIKENRSRYHSGILASDSTLTLIRTTVSNNYASGSPAITLGKYPATIMDSLIMNNQADLAQAAGILAGAKTRIENSSLFDNRCNACKVGGIYAEEGVEIINTAVLKNFGKFSGGILTAGEVTIRNSTIAGNTVEPFEGDRQQNYRFSGGLASTAGAYENALPILLQNTIIAENIGGDSQCAEDLLPGSSHNFTSDASCEAMYSDRTNPFDINEADKNSTTNWSLKSDHITASGGDISTCTEKDMLGNDRLDDGNCSLGSVEHQSPVALLGDSQTKNSGGGTLSILSIFLLALFPFGLRLKTLRQSK